MKDCNAYRITDDTALGMIFLGNLFVPLDRSRSVSGQDSLVITYRTSVTSLPLSSIFANTIREGPQLLFTGHTSDPHIVVNENPSLLLSTGILSSRTNLPSNRTPKQADCEHFTDIPYLCALYKHVHIFGLCSRRT